MHKLYKSYTIYNEIIWGDVMTYEKKKKFIVNIIFFAIIAAITIFTVKYVIGWIMPFIIAFCVAAVINPFASKISKLLHVNKKISALLCTFLFYAIGVGVICLICFGIYCALRNWLVDLPDIYANNIAPALSGFMMWLQNSLSSLSPELGQTFMESADQFFSNFGSKISDISVSAISYLSSYVTKIPFYIVGIFISVISTFFISLDYENIRAFIGRQIPEKWHLTLQDVKDYGISTLGKYGKSYLLIMLITFCELSLALWLLGVKNFFIIALITAVFDIIPVCGSGGVLIPWSIFSLLQGRFAFGIGMLIVYAIITVIRQIIEPKIIGDQVGLPPIVTLMSMFLGARFLGLLGLFGFPIALVIIKQLNDSGRINFFK